MAVMTWGGVCRMAQPGRGAGRVRVWCWPPARRMWAVMVSLVRVMVTSVSRSRAMRLRSRAGVAGSFQMPGRLVTSCRIRAFCWSVSCPGCCWRALS